MRICPSIQLGAAFVFFLTQATATTLFHDYKFQGSLDDEFGGPSLVALGGVVQASSYDFAANQGLSLSGALPNPASYSIAMNFRFETVAGYRRLLEFKNLTADPGFYVLSGMPTFYPGYLLQQEVFFANVFSEFVLTRDNSTAQVSAYVDGINVINFLDPAGMTVFSGPNGIIHFFQDEGSEASAGSVNRIRLYDGALTAQEVASINDPVGTPEPATFLGVGAALVALGIAKRFRNVSTIA
jgi:hypothetical protein